MLTKNAIGNMINRYVAVLTKCRLLNAFGTLALAGTIVGTAGALVGGPLLGDAWASYTPTLNADGIKDTIITT